MCRNSTPNADSNNSSPSLSNLLVSPSASPQPAARTIATLPLELLEEVASYLPKRSVLHLGATCRTLGAPFRHRYLYSGTESFPVAAFERIRNDLSLGGYAREVTIDLSYMNPPLRDQWYLDGESEDVKKHTWEKCEGHKAELIATVLQATPRVRSLTILGEDGNRIATEKIGEAVTRLGRRSLKRLKLTPSDGSLLDRLGGNLSAVRFLILSGGDYTRGMISRVGNALKKLNALSSVEFENAHTAPGASCQGVFSRLSELPLLTKISIKTSDAFTWSNLQHLILKLPTLRSIVITDMYHGTDQLFTLAPVNDTPPLYANLKSFVYIATGGPNVSTLYTQHETLNLSSGYSELVRFVERCPNLQVFSVCNTPLYKISDHQDYPAHAWCPEELVNVLVKRPLKSLTLMGLKVMPQWLQRICEGCQDLLHLAVLVDGDARSISSWSQHFSKLSDLLVLDVALTLIPCLTDLQCPCGHTNTPHMEHIPEGSGMGRLTRRFGGKSISVKDASALPSTCAYPLGPALVRLTTIQAFNDRPRNIMRNVEGELFWVNAGIAGEKPTGSLWRGGGGQHIDLKALKKGMTRIEDRLGLFASITDCEDAVLNPATWLEVAD